MIVTSDNGGIIDDGYYDGAVRDLNGHKCNGVLRGYKGSLYEGGMREPFIARWPGKIKPGSESNELIGLVDMLATFAAVAGRDMPAGGGPDSFNVLPTLFGGHTSRDHLVVQSNGVNGLALIQPPWKLIPPAIGKHNPPELYNLDSDVSETHNVAAANPGLVEQLTHRLHDVREHAISRTKSREPAAGLARFLAAAKTKKAASGGGDLFVAVSRGGRSSPAGARCELPTICSSTA